MRRPDELKALIAAIGPARFLKLAYLRHRRERERGRVTLTLALQGGGALGAFAWGVLDGIAAEPRLKVSAISGASAGAMNAAVYATGAAAGGRAGARQGLRRFWKEVATAAAYSELLFPPALFGAGAEAWSGAIGVPRMGHPLRDIVTRHVDIEALRSPDAPRLFISATNVLTGRARIFTNADLSHDALLASACLPTLHPTVMIDGAPYWDGGFSANPPLAPLATHAAERTLLVRLIRSGADAVPSSAAEIDLYLKRRMFARPLEEDLRRLRARLPGFAEIDATKVAAAGALTSRPTPRLVEELFQQGRASAEGYAATIPARRRRTAAPVSPPRLTGAA